MPSAWDVHAHQCTGCGVVWEHDPWKLKDYARAHHCPQCGQEQYYVYQGAEHPTYLNYGEMVEEGSEVWTVDLGSDLWRVG